jgi:teichuronic acid biosynthesis glycosyltransferase TuaC
MRLLALTKIFPNSQTPLAFPHVRRQCQALANHCELTVLATLPWFPGASLLRRFRYSDEDVDKVPRSETLFGLEVQHPRTLYLPKTLAPAGLLYAASAYSSVNRHRNRVDAILSTWAYPDGYAAILLGRALGIPVFVQVIGSDLDVIAQNFFVRRQLELVLPSAAGVIAVSPQLASIARSLGAPAERILTLCTGVERAMFAPQPKPVARETLQLEREGKLLLFVGRLSHAKGAVDALRAFEQIADRQPLAKLAFVGDGPQASDIKHSPLHRAGRILTPGALPGERVAQWMAAADVVTLPSHHEGTPNVLLEALSCGRPVVSTRVGGIPSLITDGRYGELVEAGDIPALGKAYETVLGREYPVAELTSCPSLMSWDENAVRLLQFVGQRIKPSA